jgi:hypothetical protein
MMVSAQSMALVLLQALAEVDTPHQIATPSWHRTLGCSDPRQSFDPRRK